MDCPRGSVCVENTHQCVTLKGAHNWSERITENQLPVRINQITAHNGRVMIKIFDKDGNLIEARG